MPEVRLDEEQRGRALEISERTLQQLTGGARDPDTLKRKLAQLIASYHDGDEPLDEEDAQEAGLVTKQEYEVIKNPPQLEPKNKNKSKKKKKEDAKSIQEAKKLKQEQISKLRKEAEDGVFSENHPIQAFQRRDFTISVAIPGSVVERMESFKLKTYVAGQVARAIGMYRVDEVIVFNENATPIGERENYLENMTPENVELLKHVELDREVVKRIKEREQYSATQKKSWLEEKKEMNTPYTGVAALYPRATSLLPPRSASSSLPVQSASSLSSSARPRYSASGSRTRDFSGFKGNRNSSSQSDGQQQDLTILRIKDDNVFLANILYFLETPPYLRALMFPLVDFLREAAVLYPLATPHHQAYGAVLKYREGIVTNEQNMVYVGLPKLVAIDEKLKPGTRVTVYLERTYSYYYYGQLLKPRVPKEFEGLYWGYKVRLADSLSAVWQECPYGPDGYDVSIGTSERGENVQSGAFKLPRFRHLLIVLGGYEGIEKSIANDPRLKGKGTMTLFTKTINVLPTQGIQAIRTEEALLCTLAVLNRFIDTNIPPGSLSSTTPMGSESVVAAAPVESGSVVTAAAESESMEGQVEE